MLREFRIKEKHFEVFCVFSCGIYVFLHRESFEHDFSTQTNSEAETLWDYSTSSACRTRLETNQPTQIPGKELDLIKIQIFLAMSHGPITQLVRLSIYLLARLPFILIWTFMVPRRWFLTICVSPLFSAATILIAFYFHNICCTCLWHHQNF